MLVEKLVLGLPEKDSGRVRANLHPLRNFPQRTKNISSVGCFSPIYFPTPPPLPPTLNMETAYRFHFPMLGLCPLPKARSQFPLAEGSWAWKPQEQTCSGSHLSSHPHQTKWSWASFWFLFSNSQIKETKGQGKGPLRTYFIFRY